ncbi:hypothetical protein [Amycolatopsis sp. WAC 01375]|uniref:hypothetical protein n=1 Tax=Amycolatopsis sp. WAC 01375 TaxID=2203194 RepID=UPI000F7A4B51|nr:hypothetical protein [Amycolatopsis sp. WAC 01375]
MSPVFDVYVWVEPGDRDGSLSRFIDRYVDVERPGDPRFPAFVRTFVSYDPAHGDADALAELRRDDAAERAFSLYLRAIGYYGAIVTVTEEGAFVLGLSLDGPLNASETTREAADLMAALMVEFAATGGIAGVELAPPQSAAEWRDAYVLLRTVRAGKLDPVSYDAIIDGAAPIGASEE